MHSTPVRRRRMARSRIFIAPGARKGVRVILPYVFDLNDRSLRPLAGNDAGGTSYIDPCLSPDGTRLAIHRNITLDVDKPSQIGVIDLASGDYTTIGNIIGGGLHLAWMPDGKHLLMTRGVAGSGHPDNIVCTMDLAGTVTDVCPGDGPVPLPDGRICFQNETDKCWRNCAADGSDSQVCGGGLPGCVMPARSPDGLRILFIQHGPDGEHPVIVSTADWSVTPAFALPGNWTSPVW